MFIGEGQWRSPVGNQNPTLDKIYKMWYTMLTKTVVP